MYKECQEICLNTSKVFRVKMRAKNIILSYPQPENLPRFAAKLRKSNGTIVSSGLVLRDPISTVTGGVCVSKLGKWDDSR